MEERKVIVKGINCNHCKINVENGLMKINGINKALADIVNGRVLITGTQVNLDQVKNAIEELGYGYGGVSE
ncbi:MAG: heavy-metal-associated domain-containing protein [Bacteroidales bacterium]|nr:heavy-metal-associated domain-containing protein [Bacteroidales bacterium]